MHTDESTMPATKANLKAWWHHFNFAQKTKKDADNTRQATETAATVFGKPLAESLKYASAQITTAGPNGELVVWGRVPVVVAKCGLYLKEHATEVAGTFRVSGSTRRMRELQAKFETPPKYGKTIDWKAETFTSHDIASVFRRYLTQMPEPTIPFSKYEKFREPLSRPNPDLQQTIATYTRLIQELPSPNQHLLLYVLDLLSVFSRKSDKNLMTTTNLAMMFQPGLLSHAAHEMIPAEHSLNQRVVEFLITHQDWFILEMPQSQAAPPRGAPSRAFSEVESENEQSDVGGSWNLVGGRERPSIPRRRTTVESSETHGSSKQSRSHQPTTGREASVKRSMTLPSRKHEEGEERSRVLRKQKRASAAPPHHGGTTEKIKS